MLRSLYIFLLRLHPSSFRQHFASEMLGVFDHEVGDHEIGKSLWLIADAAVSLLRQWTLRSEFWEERLASVPVLSDVPSFCSLNHSRPPVSALIHGAALSAAVLGAVVFAISYSHSPTVLLPQIILPDSARSAVSPPASPTPLTADADPAKQEISFNPKRSPSELVVPVPTDTESPVLSPEHERHSYGKATRASSIAPPSLASRLGVMGASPIPTAVLQSYAGNYVANADGLVLRIREEEGRLLLESPARSQCALIPVSESRFLIGGSTGQWLEFLRARDHSVRAIEMYRNGHHIIAYRRQR
jgi:hypothetical protein